MLLISSPSTPFTSFNHIALCLTCLCTVEKGDDSYPLSHWLTGITSFPPFKTFVVEQNLPSEVVLGRHLIPYIPRLPAFWLKAPFLPTDICEYWLCKWWAVGPNLFVNTNWNKRLLQHRSRGKARQVSYSREQVSVGKRALGQDTGSQVPASKSQRDTNKGSPRL